jgi:hypothetical protein
MSCSLVERAAEAENGDASRMAGALPTLYHVSCSSDQEDCSSEHDGSSMEKTAFTSEHVSFTSEEETSSAEHVSFKKRA